MLTHLHVSHYALIEKLDIDFTSGFSVITGETGAGKSIMLGALALLTGGRADAKAIRPGAAKCCIEGTFCVEGLGLESFFQTADIDFDGVECIVRREVTKAGKSRAFINDTPVQVARLKEISDALIDIHSQHQNLLLGHTHFLLHTLDTLANAPKTLAAYTTCYEAWRNAAHCLQSLEEQAKKGQTDQEYLSFQLAQIEDAALKDGEQEELESEQNLLSHSGEIKEGLYSAYATLCNEEHDVSQLLRAAATSLHNIAGNYPDADELAERIESTRIEIDDIASELDNRTEQVDYNPMRLGEVEERLSTIYTLLQKHHVQDMKELLAVAENLRARLELIENSEETLNKARAKVERLEKQLRADATKLTELRKTAATQLNSQLVKLLQSLGMPAARVELQITPRTTPDPTGLDTPTFLFSANRNMPMQDVCLIASGGETARVMLSLKAIISQHTNLPTIIFDEIDTGVSGTMAESMARVMQQIATRCQVICITHLPQIAALGAAHYRVYKEDTEQLGTISHIVPLTEKERIQEIANMLSGCQMTEAAINNAKALLGV